MQVVRKSFPICFSTCNGGKPFRIYSNHYRTSTRLCQTWKRSSTMTTAKSMSANIASNPINPMPVCKDSNKLRTVDAATAAHIDEVLMSERCGYTLDSLMELAGFSVAQAVADMSGTLGKSACIALVCGPGNNGGDGLVAARHLTHFGYSNVHVVYPKQPQRAPFQGLRRQLEIHGIPITADMAQWNHDVDVWVDCVFGFSFDPSRGGVREPYRSILNTINQASNSIVIAVDVPSGWNVDLGRPTHEQDSVLVKEDGVLRVPDALVSLTAPKRFVNSIGRDSGMIHYVGGRFVPPRVAEELEFDIPCYEGISQIVRVG